MPLGIRSVVLMCRIAHKSAPVWMQRTTSRKLGWDVVLRKTRHTKPVIGFSLARDVAYETD